MYTACIGPPEGLTLMAYTVYSNLTAARLAIGTYEVGRSVQYPDNSLDVRNNIGHTNSFQRFHCSWYGQQQHMILTWVGNAYQ